MIRPKIVFESQKSPLGPQQVKNDPKIKSISNVRIEGTLEKKLFQLHECIPKQFLKPTPTPKKPIKSKSKVRIEGTIENKSFSTI